MRFFYYACFILFCLTGYHRQILAKDSVVQSHITSQTTPNICLVLSGGGARGFAHIGVLKYLEEQHIPIHCIAGTSMGAVIGGLYASGMSIEEIEAKLNHIHLSDIALDRVDRRDIPEPLRDDDRHYPNNATFGVSAQGIALPKGALQANQLLATLQNWTAELPPDVSFDDLPIAFRAIATDLETGEMVVFDKGPIATAIRASMAVPGVFTPVEYNGRLLSDGGAVRNLPVDVAQKAMGADVVIAVSTGTPLLKHDELNNFFQVSQQILNILVSQNVASQKKLLQAQDVLINIDLGEIGFLDFDRAKEAAQIGYENARHMHSQLQLLALSEAQYKKTHRSDAPHLPLVHIAFVDIDTDDKIPSEDIRRQLAIPIGSVYDASDINQRIAPLIYSREYDHITHQLVKRGEAYGVHIEARAKRWGPNFLKASLALNASAQTNSFSFKIGHRLPWLNNRGLEWRNDIVLGQTYGIQSELRQPILTREGMYMAPFIKAQLETLYLYLDNTRVSEYGLQSTQLGVDVGIPLGQYSTLGEVRTGLLATQYRLRPRLGGILTTQPNGSFTFTSLASETVDELALHGRFIIDQLDTPFFPSQGYYVEGKFLTGINRNRSNVPHIETHEDWRAVHELRIASKWAKHLGNNVINLGFEWGTRRQSGPAIPGIGLGLGGFQRLTAYQPNQFFGEHLVYMNATYLFKAIDFSLDKQALFLGSSWEMGDVVNQYRDINWHTLKKSVSLFIGAKTFMGPVYLGAAIGGAGAYNVFLRLGAP